MARRIQKAIGRQTKSKKTFECEKMKPSQEKKKKTKKNIIFVWCSGKFGFSDNFSMKLVVSGKLRKEKTQVSRAIQYPVE